MLLLLFFKFFFIKFLFIDWFVFCTGPILRAVFTTELVILFKHVIIIIIIINLLYIKLYVHVGLRSDTPGFNTSRLQTVGNWLGWLFYHCCCTCIAGYQSIPSRTNCTPCAAGFYCPDPRFVLIHKIVFWFLFHWCGTYDNIMNGSWSDSDFLMMLWTCRTMFWILLFICLFMWVTHSVDTLTVS